VDKKIDARAAFSPVSSIPFSSGINASDYILNDSTKPIFRSITCPRRATRKGARRPFKDVDVGNAFVDPCPKERRDHDIRDRGPGAEAALRRHGRSSRHPLHHRSSYKT
jgi:hypothetical protein